MPTGGWSSSACCDRGGRGRGGRATRDETTGWGGPGGPETCGREERAPRAAGGTPALRLGGFPMVGKRGAGFSNDWKKCGWFFQRLEKWGMDGGGGDGVGCGA